MIIWLDAQLPPSVAAWITATFGIEARAVRDLGCAMRKTRRSSRLPAPRMRGCGGNDQGQRLRGDVGAARPAAQGTTCGNTSNARLREILSRQLPAAVARLEGGESLVEIADAT